MTIESEEVTRIMGTTDLYEILEVDRKYDASEIKRSYRKLAIKIHPDRCQDQRATEAFQKVSHAYQTLLDDEKRRLYDQFGDISDRPINNQYNDMFRGQRVYTFTSNDEIDPEILFKMFFGRNFDFENENDVYRRQQYHYHKMPNRNQYYRDHQQNIQQGLQPELLPSIFAVLTLGLLFFFLVIPLFSSDSKGIFKLAKKLDGNIKFLEDEQKSEEFSRKNHDYKIVSRTERHRIKYAIKKTWLRNNMQRKNQFIASMNKAADIIYENNLRMKCKEERRKNKDPISCKKIQAHNISMKE